MKTHRFLSQKLALHGLLVFCLIAAVGCPSKPPVIQSLSLGATPITQAAATLGQVITLNGQDFAESMTVTFARQATGVTIAVSPATVTSSTQATVALPVVTGLTANLPITLVATNSSGKSSTAYTMTLVAPPVLQTSNPVVVPATIATNVQIGGLNFVTGATYVFTRVSNGSVMGTGTATVASATSATAPSPLLAGLTGAAAVRVTMTNPDGQTSETPLTLTYEAPPALATITPPAVEATLTTQITIVGSDFKPGAFVTFSRTSTGQFGGNVPATVENSSTLTCWTPVLNGLVDDEAVVVHVINPDGQVGKGHAPIPQAKATLIYVAPPVVSTVAPASISASFGGTLTITGKNFYAGAVVLLALPDTTEVSVIPTIDPSGTSLTAAAPVLNVTTNSQIGVSVKNPSGQESEAAHAVTYVAPPIVSSLAVNGNSSTDHIRATVPETVTVTGANFATGAQVLFNFPGGVQVQGTGVSVGAGGTTVTCTSPVRSGFTANTPIEIRVRNTTDNQISLTPVAATYIPEPIVVAPTPSQIPVTIATPVVVTGSGFQAGATVTFFRHDGTQIGAPIAASTVAPGSLTVTSPVIAGVLVNEIGAFRVTNPDTQLSAPNTAITLVAPPIVSGVLPTNTPATLPAVLTISGSNFTPTGLTVVFYRSNGTPIGSPVTPTSNTDTSITVTAPAIAGLTADEVGSFAVVNADVQTSSPRTSLTFDAPPVLSGILVNGLNPPNNVRATVADNISISGANFDAGAEVSFAFQGDGAALGTTVNVLSATQITCQSPLNAALTTDTNVLVTVRNTTDGQVSEASLPLVYVPGPTISSFSPTTVTATIAVPFTLSGANFQNNPVTSVSFRRADTDALIGTVTGASLTISGSGVNMTATGLTPTTTSLTAPTAVNVIITNADGQSAISTSATTYIPAPSISGFTPSTVTATVGVPFTLSGANFQNASGTVVTFRRVDTSAVIGTVSGTALTIAGSGASMTASGTTPTIAGLPSNKTVSVTIANADGQVAAAPATTTYVPEPTLSGFTPATVTATIGKPFVLTGANFQNTTGTVVTFTNAATSAVIGTLPVSSLVFGGSGSALTFSGTTPTIHGLTANTTVNISLTNADGQVSPTPRTTTYVPEPIVTSLSSYDLPTRLQYELTIVGSGFQQVVGQPANADGPTVTFTTTGAPVSAVRVDWIDATTIKAISPIDLTILTRTAATINVTNPDLQVSGAVTGVYYNPPPTVTSIDLTQVPSTISTLVTITGANFRPRSTVAFYNSADQKIGEVDATLVDATHVTCMTPTTTITADDPGVKVFVVDPQTQPSTQALTITYLAPPTITAYLPDTTVGATISEAFSLTGTNLRNNATVQFFNGATLIGSAAGLAYTPLTQIDGMTPTIGTLTVPTTVTVKVTNVAAGPGAADGQFVTTTVTYVPGPSISSISPTSVPASVGTAITITGANFDPVNPGTTVTFTGAAPLGTTTIPAGSVTVVNATTIQVTTPTAAYTTDQTVNVTVTNPDAQVSNSSAITYLAPPTLTGSMPTSVPATISSTLTLTGTNFRTGSQVVFSGATFTSAATVTATVAPGGASLTVQTPTASDTTDPTVTFYVQNPDGQQSTTRTVTYQSPPTISAYATSPVTATIGQAFTLTGTHFRTGATVEFRITSSNALIGSAITPTLTGTTQADGTTPTISTLTATTPVTVKVINTDGQSTTHSISYVPQPEITSASPTSIPATVATTVSLVGTNFVTGATVTVVGAAPLGTVAGIATTFTDAQHISFTSPTAALTSDDTGVTIVVHNPDTQVSSAYTVTYVAPPSITSISPTSVPATIGTTLTITGTNFKTSGTTTVEFVGAAPMGTTTATATVTNSTTLTVTSPTAAFTSDQTVAVTVINPDTQRSGSSNITYTAPPTITNFNPNPVPATVATAFTITGTNLRTGATLDFSIGATSIGTPTGTVTPLTTITGTTPTTTLNPAVPTTVVVTVTNTDGQSTTRNITYNPGPQVSSVVNISNNISEVSATTTPFSRTVQITGNYFTTPGNVTVEFRRAGVGGAVIGAPLTVATVSATTLATCTAPALTTGTLTADEAVVVRVINPDTQYGEGSINYQAEPSLSSIVSDNANTSLIPATITTQFTLTGTNFITEVPGSSPTANFAVPTAAGSPFAVHPVTVSSGTSITGTAPTVTITSHQTATVTLTDYYGQVSNSVTIQYTAPPTVTAYSSLFTNFAGTPLTSAADVAPGTTVSPASTFTLTGTNFMTGAVVHFGRKTGSPSTFGGDVGTTVSSATSLTGTNPVIPGLTATATDVTVTAVNPDGQSSSAYDGASHVIKFNARPVITSVKINGASTGFNMFIANGAQRNDDSGTHGTTATFVITGSNLDSAPPAGGGGTALAFTGGVVASNIVAVSDTSLAYRLADNTNTRLADVLGAIDITSVTNHTGQTSTTGLTNAMMATFGPTTTGEAVGQSVALADVNGDGTDDVILVSAGPTGLIVRGWFGTTNNTLSIVPNFTFTPAGFGTNLVTPGCRNIAVGHFNSDAYEDVAVGIPDANFVAGSAGTSAGGLLIFYGSAAGLTTPTVIDAVTDYTYAVGTGFGAALASGDYNGDGIDDLLVGAPGFDNTGVGKGFGKVLLYEGVPSSSPGIESGLMFTLDQNTGTTSGGADKNDYLGLGVAFVDINGDGRDDIFAGAPGYNVGAYTDSGRIWFLKNGDVVPGGAGFSGIINGSANGQALGFPEKINLNGDAYDDLLLGAPNLGINFAGATAAKGTIYGYTGALSAVSPTPFSTFTGLSVNDSGAGLGSTMEYVDGLGLFVSEPFNNTGIGEALIDYVWQADLAGATPSFDFVNEWPAADMALLGFGPTGERFASSFAIGSVLGGAASDEDAFYCITNAGGTRGVLIVVPNSVTLPPPWTS